MKDNIIERLSIMKYGLIGKKLDYSFSKEIHETLAPYTYELLPLEPSSFHQFMKERNFYAINVTAPYKKDVIPYLDTLDDIAKATQAVNTVVHKQGKLIGYNTDVAGFHYMLRYHQIQMKDKKVIILGNGGVAQAIKYVLKQEQVENFYIIEANPREGISYEECYQYHNDAQIIINASPVGTSPALDDTPLSLDTFFQCEVVIDIIYNPILTKLTVQAHKKGIKHINGLEMLIAQAVYAVELFLNVKIDEHHIHQLYQQWYKKLSNIVLIGMPSAGKTTIGKLLEDKLNKRCIDIDEVIVERTGKSIPELFTQYKESGFRDIEKQVVKEVSTLHNVIIATGGGTITQQINIERLQANGIIVFIDRPLTNLISKDSQRPLLHTTTLQQIYDERYPLYKQYADIIISNNQTLSNVVNTIVNLIEIYDIQREKKASQ